MKHQKTLLALALIASAATTGTAQASLFDRGNGLIYNDVTNTTWAQDANLFQTQAAGNANLVADIIAANNGVIYETPNGLDPSGIHTLNSVDFTVLSGSVLDGTMSWWGAQAWIGYLNKTSYDGYSNWALPTTVPGLSGYNQTGSQMDELFYNELGGVAGNSLNTTHNANYNLFTNVLQNSVNAPNWSGTDVLYVGNAWVFDVRNGNQGNAAKSDQFYAWAVRSGDVSAVSVPGAVWLFASGLMGLLGFKRRKVA